MKDGTVQKEGTHKQHKDSIKEREIKLAQEFVASVKKYKEKLRQQQECQLLMAENPTLKTDNKDQLDNQKHDPQASQQFWKMFLFVFTKHKQSPFALNSPFFQVVYKQLLSILECVQQQPLDEQKPPQHLANKFQQPAQTLSTIGEDSLDLATSPHSRFQQQQQQLQHPLQHHPPIPDISSSLKRQLTKYITLIENIFCLQLLINIYTNLNLSEWVTRGRFIDQYVLIVMERKLEEIQAVRYQVDWSKVQSDQPQDHHIQAQGQSHLWSNSPKENIYLYIKQQFQLNSFYSQLTGKFTTARNPIRIFNCFSRITTFCANLDHSGISIYLHSLHKIADKKKHFLIAKIFHSKCFLCSTERFKSESIHQVRIYQKFMKKFNNFLYNHIPSF